MAHDLSEGGSVRSATENDHLKSGYKEHLCVFGVFDQESYSVRKCGKNSSMAVFSPSNSLGGKTHGRQYLCPGHASYVEGTGTQVVPIEE